MMREHNTGRYPKSCPTCATFARQRAADIWKARQEGQKLRVLAEQFHISRSRVQQIVEKEQRRRDREAWLLTRPAVVELLEDDAAPLPAQPTPEELMQLSIERLPISVRAYNSLVMMGVRSIGELTCKTDRELLSRRNLGKTTLNELKEVLLQLGLGTRREAA